MLEIKNLTKTYKTKGGADTHALDGVSVTFPETGMVFLLGKSGSGKSTLLNLCGGLDAPTSGEIIVRGRSSKNFSGSDFDSYRNTFIGFIFQEYNILNEFTVEENLAIALELQGKPKDKKKIAELLEKVDLKGYAKRKPNTLSGGQKQRIAIARALIKDPKIIMADEPTGALDSATGKQVFDTLKNLSRDRLVIVVSHDREFAEIYGDRIIELKDGKIISDISKERVSSVSVSENVSAIGADTLSVKKGSAMSEKDFEKVKEFLIACDGDVIISGGKENVDSFKKANRIGDDGSTESFADTKTDKIVTREYTKAERKFVRSKLPISKAIKMGASSLKVKPFRLFLTILLSVVAFVMFGVFSTLMTYDENGVVAESLAKSDYNAVLLGKNYRVTYKSYRNGELEYSYENTRNTVMTEEDVASLGSALGTYVVPFYNFSDGYSGSSISIQNVTAETDSPKPLTDYSFSGFAVLSERNGDFPLIAGGYPKNEGEIAVSGFTALALSKGKLFEVDEFGNTDKSREQPIADIGGVIGKKLALYFSSGSVIVRIVGVFDGGDVPERFAGYDTVSGFTAWNQTTQMAYLTYMNETMQKVACVSDGFYSFVAEKIGYRPSREIDIEKYFRSGKYYYSKEGAISDGVNYYTVYGDAEKPMLKTYFFDHERTTLSRGEVVVYTGNLPNFTLSDERMEDWNAAHAEYVEKRDAAYAQAEAAADAADRNYYQALAYIYETVAYNPNDLKYAIENRIRMNYTYYPALSDAERAEYSSILKELYSDYVPSDQLSVTLENNEFGGRVDVTVCGFYFNPSAYGENYSLGFYVSADDLAEFETDREWTSENTTKYSLKDSSAYYSGVFVVNERNIVENVLKLTNDYADDDSSYYINNSLYLSVNMISSTVKNMQEVFLYVGIALAAFAALLLFNFISVSITNKMHEIGVLRAVGARGADIFKIFFSESFIISLICISLAVVGTLITLSLLNASLSEALTFSMQLFVFGPISLVMLVGVAFAVALLGTLLPVARISSKRPVDSMKA